MNRPKSVTLGLFLGALLVLTRIATLVPVLPKAEAATNTISTNTTVQSFTANQGDTAIINSGVSLTAFAITNHGTIINYGAIYDYGNLNSTGSVVNNGTMLVAGSALNDGGTIDSYGHFEFWGQADPGFVNNHGGKINIKQGGSLLFQRGGSWAPHDLYNENGSVIDNFGSATETGYGGMSIVNSATIHNECNATFTIPVSGNAVIDRCVVPTTDTLTIKSQYATGNPISGYWTVLYDANGNVLKTGFTPATFTLNAGQQYRTGMGNFGSFTFDHWLDNNSTANPRNVSINANAQLTAVYKTTSKTIMSDTTVTFGSHLYSGRPFNGEWAKPGSVLIGKQIDSITVQLQKVGAPPGTYTVGVYDANLHLKKAFGIVNTSTLLTTYTDIEFKLPSTDPLYTIQQDDRIGVFYNGGSTSSGLNAMIDRNTADPFDGTNSQRVRFESGGWLYFDTGEEMYMILKQTHA